MASSSSAGSSSERASSEPGTSDQNKAQTEAEEMRLLARKVAKLELQSNTPSKSVQEDSDEDDDDDNEDEQTPEQLVLEARIQEELTIPTKDGFVITHTLYKRDELFRTLHKLKKQAPRNLAKIQEVEMELNKITHAQHLNKRFADTYSETSERMRTRLDNVPSPRDAKAVLISVFARTLKLQRKALEASEKGIYLQKRIREKQEATASLKQKIADKKMWYATHQAVIEELDEFEEIAENTQPPPYVAEAPKSQIGTEDNRIAFQDVTLDLLKADENALELDMEKMRKEKYKKQKKNQKKKARKAKKKALISQSTDSL